MWQEAGQLAAELLIRDKAPDQERIFDGKDRSRLRVPFGAQDSFKSRLNLSGWLDDEVEAAGLVEQGKKPTALSLLTGWAAVEAIRARRCKNLPREFCLAMTGDRVVAIAVSAMAEGDDTTDMVVKLKREELGSWARGAVRVELEKPGATEGRLSVPGAEPFPVNWGSDPSTAELVELLSA